MRVLPICGRVSDRARLSAVPVIAAARMPSGAYPRFLSRSAAYPRRVLPSCPLAIPFDSPARGRNVHRPPYCCVLPVVTLHVLTAADLVPAHIQCGPASRNLLSLCTSRCSQQSNRALMAARFGYAAATATAPALDALLRAGVPRLCDGTTSAKCSVTFLRCFFSGCAAGSSSVQGAAFRWSPIPKRVHSVAVCRTSCNVPSVVCCKDASILLELEKEQPRTSVRALPIRLISDTRAKPPANPMDIACPASSLWVALNLIRFKKRPLHFAAVTEGVFARQSGPLDGPFQESRCACARLVIRRIPAP